MKTTAIALALALLPVQSVMAADLGRLFFTPEQRVQLEREHAQQTAATFKAAPVLNGIVQKSSGPRTVWINGIIQDDGGSDEHAPDSQAITLPGSSHPVLLKVGQRLLP